MNVARRFAAQSKLGARHVSVGVALPCGAVAAWSFYTQPDFKAAHSKAVSVAEHAIIVARSTLPVAHAPAVSCEEKPVPTISLEEVRKHHSPDSLWITYNGEVYDVTEILNWHPGGKEALLGAGGLDITAFWEKYQIHYKSAKATDRLEKCKIGKLSEKDAELAEAMTDPETGAFQRGTEALSANPNHNAPVPASVERAAKREAQKTSTVVKIVCVAPFMNLTRHVLRFVGLFCRPLAAWIAKKLPFSVPGLNEAGRLDKSKKPTIAVVGGGIAGCGCAYALNRSGYEVVLYEPREILGGNAQMNTFHHNGKDIRQDLTVLFWAKEFYKNYTALLGQLGIEPAIISATYSLRTNRYGQEEWFTPPGTEAEKILKPSLKDRFPEDFKKFDNMVKWVHRIDNIFTLDPRPSFYKHVGLWSYCNPLNYIGLKRLCAWNGISMEWYETVLRPFHGWNFSSILIDDLPAVAIGALDILVPMNHTRKHESWGPGNSKEVFDKMTRGIDVRLNNRVDSVKERSDGRLDLTDEHGKVQTFDRVVLTGPAGAMANVYRGNSLQQGLLDGVLYHDDFHRSDWKDWLENPVHSDDVVVPGNPEQKKALMRDLSFIVDVDAEKKHAEYTHILGSWSPAAKALGEHGAPMFVTQSVHPDRPIDEDKIMMRTSAPRAHPDLCMTNILVTQMMSLVQGKKGVYYAGNWTTGGNGHDLSFLSGLCVAGAIGADHPFADNDGALLDYHQQRTFMGLPAAPNTATKSGLLWPAFLAAMGLGFWGIGSGSK